MLSMEEGSSEMTIEEILQFSTVPSPALSQSDLKRFERRSGIKLPEELHQFLVRCNGAFLDGVLSSGGVCPDKLFGVRTDDDEYSIQKATRRYSNIVPKHMIPIGVEHSPRVLACQWSGIGIGSVWIWKRGDRGGTFVADSFGSFLDDLRVAEHRSVAQILHDYGRSHYDDNRFRSALRCFQRSWKLEPSGETAHWIANTTVASGGSSEAILWRERAYTQSPDTTDIVMAYAEQLMNDGSISTAKLVLNIIISSCPSLAPAIKLLNKINTDRSAGS